MAPWFSELDLTDATAPQRHVVRRVEQLLDTLQPARLLPHDQEAELAAGDGVEFLLRHDTAPWVTIEAWIASDEAGFFGMLTDETYSLGYTGEGEDDAIARLADLLTAPYSYEWFTVGGRPWQMVITAAHLQTSPFTARKGSGACSHSTAGLAAPTPNTPASSVSRCGAQVHLEPLLEVDSHRPAWRTKMHEMPCSVQ